MTSFLRPTFLLLKINNFGACSPVALPALAANMPSNKLTPKLVQELYPEQDPAEVEKLIASSKELQKVCALLNWAVCQSRF